MLIYFHKNKARYEKGQMTPFFILILVVLIIMAMVTVNLSKVAFIKTDSSNAVDAGALAAGSVMANVFNAVASANAQMEFAYWSFFTAVSVSFAIAFWNLISAYTQACPKPCSAVTAITWFIRTTLAILIAVTAFWIAQRYFYLLIREMAWKGRESAIEMAHRFTFMNSGIGSKLKAGEPLDEITEPERRRNYREVFSDFLDETIDEDKDTEGDIQLEYTYAWEDGQARDHSVVSRVGIDEVDTFDLRVTVLPYPVEAALLGTSLGLAYSAEGSLTAAGALYSGAVPVLIGACACQACCGPWAPGCCVCWAVLCATAMGLLGAGMVANSAAIASMTPIFYLMAAAWAGLLPGWTFTSSSDSDALAFIICWIDEIEHDRLVRVDTWQYHAGAELGLWQTRYPDIHSFSVVDFRGMGQIHDPVLRHDASIIETDRIGTQ